MTARTTDPDVTTHVETSRLHRLAVRTGAMARPISGRRFFPLYGVIHHVGRKTGRAYAAPVVVRRASDAIIVPLPFGEGTGWYRNALAAGGVRVTWKGRDHWFANPTIVGMADARHGFTRVMRALMAMSGLAKVVRFDLPRDLID